MLLLKRIFLLFSELGAPGVRDKFESKRNYPSGEAEADGDDPVSVVKSVGADFHRFASKLCNDCLTSKDDHKDYAVGAVVKDSTKDVDLVVDDSAVDHVENLHDHKDIEHIGHVSACSLVRVFKTPEFCTIPVRNSAWVDIGLVSSFVSVLNFWLGVEILTSENDDVDDYDFIDSHT